MGQTFYLGVEGGATRTTGVVADEALRVLGRRVAGPSNVHAVGAEQARAAILDILVHALVDAGARIDTLSAMAFCIAGIRSEQDQRVWRRILKKLNLAAPAVITHDAAAGLAAGSPDETGILVLCGTGSLVYGRRADGAERFVGGRGPILGDEGSGFDIGLHGLRAAIRASDGRGAPTLLMTLIPERLHLGGLDDLVPWVSPFAKDRVASVAPVVFEAEAEGDAAAAEIVRGAVDELARNVGVLARSLWPRGGKVGKPERVILTGGVLRHQAGMRAALAAAVSDLVPDARCGIADVEGAVGAARIARHRLLAQVPQDQAFFSDF